MWHFWVVVGWQRVCKSIYKLKCPCNQKTLSLLLTYLSLLTPYYYRFPSLKVMGICFPRPHFLLSLLLSCCSLFSVLYVLINFLRKVTIYCSNYIRKGRSNTKQTWGREEGDYEDTWSSLNAERYLKLFNLI